VRCALDNSSTRVAIDLTVAEGGMILGGAQYRLFLDLDGDGNEDEFLKYKDGQTTGMSSLQVTQLDDRTLRFEFDLAELGWSGTEIHWYAEIQDGVAGGAGQGFVDRMPDSGYYLYQLR
jgi:hypothetical protein